MFYKIKAAILKRYIVSFCDDVRAEYSQLNGSRRPEVTLHKQEGRTAQPIPGADLADKAPDGQTIVSGYYENGKIEIFGVARDSLAYLKQTARHETIHFLLDAAGLDYRDTDDLFILLAIKYDARPAADLSDDFYIKISKGRNF